MHNFQFVGEITLDKCSLGKLFYKLFKAIAVDNGCEFQDFFPPAQAQADGRVFRHPASI